MERTVPRTASEEIELYLRTIYSLLRTTTEVQIRTLEEVHAGMNSSLHPNARSQAPDMSAFIYSLLRLPASISEVRTVILGQNLAVFRKHGFQNVESWEEISSSARRRRGFYDRHGTLAYFIASRTDIDDVIPTLTAFQIEWNKMNLLLQSLPSRFEWNKVNSNSKEFDSLRQAMQTSTEDLERLSTVWGDLFIPSLQCIATQKCAFQVRLLDGSLAEYWRSTRLWWENIEHDCPAVLERPLYFVSSNTHSIANLLSGEAFLQQDELLHFLARPENNLLKEEWEDIRERRVPSSMENFLYYLLKKYQQSEEGKQRSAREQASIDTCDIQNVRSQHTFHVDAQIIDLACIDVEHIDPRLQGEDLSYLKDSDALILNIDYPLGLAAYNILAKVAEHASPILGVYSMGKAATLNGVIGDVMIPNVVHDEQSQNTYLFQNAFSGADVSPYLIYGTVLDNQKTVSVLGTFLQNAKIMDVFYREGYTDIEMEAGPYLSAVFEMYRPRRHPVNEILNLYGLPFDLGILHYASDTPLSKGKNLGAGALSYFGMDSTYATSIAILKRIFKMERQRVGSENSSALRDYPG
jgi:hypothetical protein